MGYWIMQTLEKPKLSTGEESRKSSICQPGSISKYSDMLVVDVVVFEIFELEDGFEFCEDF